MVLCGTLCPTGGAVAAGDRRPLLELPVRILVAQCDGEPVRPRRWIRRHVAAANDILERYRVRLRPDIVAFEPGSCVLLDRGARDALAGHVTGRAPVVLVVRRVRDVDVPSYDLMGVHWRYGGAAAKLRGRRWVLLTARAEPPVLAHELCHYFGLPHDRGGGNLMTPGPSDPAWRLPAARRPRPYEPRLTRRQALRLRRAVGQHLRRMARSGESAAAGRSSAGGGAARSGRTPASAARTP